MTSLETMMSRTTVMSIGAAVPRTIERTTSVPFLPRILFRAPSTVSPSSEVPSTETMTSPALTPAFSDGEPSIGVTTTSRQSGPRVVQSDVAPLASWVPISAPIPSNWPDRSRWRNTVRRNWSPGPSR